MELTAIIIDDEESARETLSGLVQKYTKGIKIISQAASVNSGVLAIQKHMPDVVFLDIKMSGGSGFDLLEKLPEINFEIIFTTAYDRYALKAIKFSALDYLLKPISISDLKAAVDKIQKRKQQQTGEQLKRHFQIFNENKQDGDPFRKIALPSSKGIIVIEIKDVIRCEGYKNYTTFYLVNGERHVVSKTLKEFEEMLDAHNFVRIFQSHLVNISHVKKYLNGRGGTIEMADGGLLPVSREKKKELLEKLSSLQ